MTLHVVVADRLEPLAHAGADVLAVPLADPFAREVVAVPGDGVRTWLTQQWSAALGVVANVDFVFPGALVRRALGTAEHADPWSLGPLTWAVHDVLCTRGHELGLPPDAVRARSIADLFDRYSLHRPSMALAWERGYDVDAQGVALPPSQRWQPALWRHLVQRLGPSEPGRLPSALDALRSGRATIDLPARVVLVGLAGLPARHLEVLAALGVHREVYLFAPVPSLVWWERVRRVAARVAPGSVPRASDPSADVVHHRLARTWGRTARESQLLVLATAAREGAPVSTLASLSVSPPVSPPTTAPLLARLQAALRADDDPVAGPVPLEAGDSSLVWHRCHGIARQVEVLRDVVLRLLEERAPDDTPLFEPRDIVVLCPDVAAVAPLVDALFAGDGPSGSVPAIPVRVADRSVRRDTPLLDAVASLLDVIDGRFRVSDVLSLAARSPVSRMFGFTPDALGRIARWLDAVEVRWGVDADQRGALGLPAQWRTNTWQAGLDQLLLGAALADAGPRVSLAGVVPFDGIEGDDLELLGALADFVHRLRQAVDGLSSAQPVAAWCEALSAAARSLCALDDVDAWQWQVLERELDGLRSEAVVGDEPSRHAVSPGEMVVVLEARLGGRPGRPRFGSGAVTVSSFTAQRGVPHRVVCLLGLDGDLGVSSMLSADDVMVAAPCVGDRDARAEVRAQLLDAVLAAGERLVLCSNGRDLATNAEVPPPVVLSELLDVIDRTAAPPVAASGVGAARASEAIATDHPRHGWAAANFLPGALGAAGPWSFDAAACAAAVRQRSQEPDAPFLRGPLPPRPDRDEIPLEVLHRAVTHPVQLLLQDRLGVALDDDDAVRDDLVPLGLAPLPAWHLAERLLHGMLDDALAADAAPAATSRREEVERARGVLPPFAFGDQALADARGRAVVVASALLECLARHDAPVRGEPIAVAHPLAGHHLLTGRVPRVHGSLVVRATVSAPKPAHRLDAWIDLAVLTLVAPSTPWQAVLVHSVATRSAAGPRAQVEQFTLGSPEMAHEVLALALDLAARAERNLVPALAGVTAALYRGDRSEAGTAWAGRGARGAGSSDRWLRFAVGATTFEQALATPASDDEDGPEWGSGGRLERWAHRIWSLFAATTLTVGEPAADANGDGSDDGEVSDDGD